MRLATFLRKHSIGVALSVPYLCVAALVLLRPPEPRPPVCESPEIGVASWYGPAFHGRTTATGESFDQDALTAAHPSLPLPSLARVTNLKNGKDVIVRVNDRGPYAEDRIIDLSRAAADELDFIEDGFTRVRLCNLGLAPADEEQEAP